MLQSVIPTALIRIGLEAPTGIGWFKVSGPLYVIWCPKEQACHFARDMPSSGSKAVSAMQSHVVHVARDFSACRREDLIQTS